ncbi:multicopper oxidase family protein [Candidatus Acetothermia bacterium]|nr:multicopper oxidase family protein [Candidatus Acetothermia bacterium]
MDRRTFLKSLGAVGALSLGGILTGCKDQLTGASTSLEQLPSGPPADGIPKLTHGEIQLVARPTRWELAPGKVVTAWGYNGQVPGPEIRVREREQVRVVLTNELPELTTIHWHGINVPNAMDGVPFVTQEPVPSGGQFIYEFIAKPAGTRWYHTHFNEKDQLEKGLYAPFIIEPSNSQQYDREFTLALDDWNTGASPSVSSGNSGMGGMMGEMMSHMMGGQMGNMMGGQTPNYDTYTISGKAWPATQPLLVHKGERVKLRLINASATETHTIHLAGHALKVTHTDGNALANPEEADAVRLAPAERVDVKFFADNPDIWELRCLDGDHAQRGMKTVLQYEGFSKSARSRPAMDRALRVWSYANQSQGMMSMNMSSVMTLVGADGKFSLTLSGGMMMNPDVWTINGRTYPNTEPLWVKQGDRVRVKLFNMSMESHPMHLHGHTFRVLSINGQPSELLKDTVNVGHMETVEIEFDADNPGNWFFHCHKPMHMEGGMISLVKYR